MAIQLDNIAQITARAGVGRAGTMRAGVATTRASELKSNGQLLWDRTIQAGSHRDQNPPGASESTWTNTRD